MMGTDIAARVGPQQTLWRPHRANQSRPRSLGHLGHPSQTHLPAPCPHPSRSVLSPGVVWELYEFVIGRPPVAPQPARSSFHLQARCASGTGIAGLCWPQAQLALRKRPCTSPQRHGMLPLWSRAAGWVTVVTNPSASPAALLQEDSDYDPYGEEEED